MIQAAYDNTGNERDLLLNFTRKKGLVLSLLVTILLVLVSLTGCVSKMTPVGWSGVIIDGDTAYTGSKEGRLIAVNLKDYSVIKTDQLTAPPSGGLSCSSSSATVAIYGTPAIASNIPLGVDDNGAAIIGSAVIIAGYNGKVIAYDGNNNRNIIWEYPKGGNNISPIVSAATVAGNTLYFGSTDGNLYALDSSLGNEKWKFASYGEIWSSPVVDKNLVFIGSFDKKVYALEAATGEKKWEFHTEAANIATPLVLDGVLYFGSMDRNFYAIEETTGKERWRFQASNWFWAKPVAISGVIYTPCMDNKIYGLDAQNGEILATYDMEEDIASWPVVFNNKIIVATMNGKLLSVDVSSPDAQPRTIATIVENVKSPLAIRGEVVYINGPDDVFYGYNVVTGAKLPPVSLASK